MTDEQIHALMPQPTKLFEDDNNIVVGYTRAQIREVVRAAEAALAEPQGEPVAWVYHGIRYDGIPHASPSLIWRPEYMDAMSSSKGVTATPLYAHPAPVALAGEVVAWLHPANPSCVTTDPTAYARGIPLVRQAAPAPGAPCRDDGRCQYAIDHGAEGMGQCPKGKCAMPASVAQPTDEQILEAAEPFGAFEYGDAQGDARIKFARAVLALRDGGAA